MIFQMFTVIFTVEMAVKLVALGPLYYIQGKWNIFDGIIVIISLVDTGLELADFRESSGTSVFRTFRLVSQLKNVHHDSDADNCLFSYLSVLAVIHM